MGTVASLSEEIARGLQRTHPGLRKTLVKKLAPCIAAVMQTQTANTAAWAAVLPIETERADMRLQWIARLLANPRLNSAAIMAPFAQQQLCEAAAHAQTIVLSMDQTDLGDRFAILMLSVRVGDRALPLVWTVQEGAAKSRLRGSTHVAGYCGAPMVIVERFERGHAPRAPPPAMQAAA